MLFWGTHHKNEMLYLTFLLKYYDITWYTLRLSGVTNICTLEIACLRALLWRFVFTIFGLFFYFPYATKALEIMSLKAAVL